MIKVPLHKVYLRYLVLSYSVVAQVIIYYSLLMCTMNYIIAAKPYVYCLSNHMMLLETIRKTKYFPKIFM